MEVPAQTGEIFEILSRGQFICSNSPQDSMRRLYNIIEDENNFDILHDYFQSINFVLEKGDEYFYFSRAESKVDLERKIEIAFMWIDFIDFFKTYDNSFGSNFRFSPSDVLVRVKTDAELESKLEGLKKHTGKEKHSEIIDKALELLVKNSFIDLENEISNQYKVLSSFKYLEELILTINIPDEIRNEIPE